eukprot:scaffold3570_cov227-Amphora_coffeaeformis.AAC.8
MDCGGDIAVATASLPEDKVNVDLSSRYEEGSSSSYSSSSESSLAEDEQERYFSSNKLQLQQQPLRQQQEQQQDLCGGFRLFPQRPSSLLIHIDSHEDKEVDSYCSNKNKDDDEEEDNAAAAATTLLSPLSCFEKQQYDNGNDTLFCTPSPSSATTSPNRNSNRRRSGNNNKNNSPSSMMNLLSLSPSFSWLDKQQQQQQYMVEEQQVLDDTCTTTTTTITAASDLATRPRRVWIVTTAALPWMTGTAVNPVLRAAYLWQTYHDMSTKQQQQPSSSSSSSSQADTQEEEGIFYDAVEDEEEEEEAMNTTTFAVPSTTTISDEEDTTDDSSVSGTTHQPASWSITLVIPWLERPADRVELYGADWADATRHDQEAVIRTWLRDTAQQPGAAQHLQMAWYRARYYPVYRSIFPAQDVCQVLEQLVPERSTTTTANTRNKVPHDDPDCPVCILEEPEHLLLYRTLRQKPDTHPFQGMYTLGILHTNYKSYAAQGALGLLSEMVAQSLCATVAAAYTDKLIKLSATLQTYAPHKETVCNVHGIRQDFLDTPAPTGQGIYFIGKLLWAKGLDKLLTFQRMYSKHKQKQQSGSGRNNNSGPQQYFAMDIYGSGPDQEEIEAAFCGRKKRPLPVRFCGRADHAAIGPDYKIFVNPSVTEVLCTTSAEALAMNKFVIMPEHPSNAFFEAFPNALLYKTPQEFCSLLLYAQSHDPVPLGEDLRHALSWQAATDRLMEAAAMSPREAARIDRMRAVRDNKCYEWHAGVCGGRFGKTIQKSFFGVFEEDEDESATAPSGGGGGSSSEDGQ